MFLKMTPFFMHNRVFFGVSLWQLCRFEWIWVCLSEELYRIVWAFAGMKPTLRENERWRRDRALFIPTNYWHAETVEIVFRVQSRSLTSATYWICFSAHFRESGSCLSEGSEPVSTAIIYHIWHAELNGRFVVRWDSCFCRAVTLIGRKLQDSLKEYCRNHGNPE